MISMQLSMTVAESQVEDYAAVYGARLLAESVVNRVVTKSEVRLMPVVMQTCDTWVSSQLQVMRNRELVG